MKSNKLKRVVFYSKEDWAAGSNLKNAEELLKNFKSAKNADINDILELYHVKLYFDNDLFLPAWDESLKNSYKEIVKQVFADTKQFMLSITDDDIIGLIETLEFSYRKSFWELVNNLKIYKQIKQQTFSKMLNKYPFQINYILAHKNIVNYFDKNIIAFLLDYEKSAELLLAEFEEHRSPNSTRHYFPGTLTYKEKEEIIVKYAEAEDANLNYIRLIEHSNSNELKLSAKIKLMARKKADQLSDKYFNEEHSFKIGVQVTLDKDQPEPVKFENQDYIFKASYGEGYLNKQPNDITLFRCFAFPFFYIDDRGLITLINKKSEMDTMETIFMKSKNEYEHGIGFRRKSNLAYMQVVVFDHYLKQNNNSIEKVIESFIHEYLNACFEIKNIRFSFPTTTSTYLEKIRALTPEFDFLLKQYNAYVDDGYIDFEFLQFSSYPLRLSEIKSLVDKKYVYANDDKINNLIYHFFSDQGMLHYVEPYKEKYNNLYDLLTKENVELSNYENYQTGLINYLIKEDYLHINDNGILKIKKPLFMSLIRDTYNDEVLNYWYYPKELQVIIDEMLSQNLLISKSTLLSEQEISYFNFYLNKKEFTNGHDLRNKYLHGTNTASEKEHEHDYYILLQLIILVLLKIEGDLVVGNKCIE